MIVRSHLPWPLRWAALALMLGFSAALALWAFEFGKDIAGLDRGSRADVGHLRQEIEQLRNERDHAQSIANTADSLLKAERVAQEKLAAQVRALEADNMALRADLGFFERLLPAGASGEVTVRGLQAQLSEAGQMRYQLLVMQQGRAVPEFNGRYELVLSGQLDGKPWSYTAPGGARPLKFRQYQRVEGVVDYPADATLRQVQVKVLDSGGGVRATQLLRL